MQSIYGLKETPEEALNKISGGYILDVATGKGGFINYLMENLGEYIDITGIDHDERSLEIARQTLDLENIHFKHMDAARMEFPDEHFDTVCIANSLHHMHDLDGVLSEMRRVCKPGGCVIINEMYRDDQSETQLTHVYLHHWWAAVDDAEGITHSETFTRRQLEQMINKMALRHTKVFELKDLESDPRDAELVQSLDEIIDRYIQRAQGLDAGMELCQRGEELRQRVHSVGFHGATSILAIGEI